MNKKTKIARIYCRVSTKEQNLDRQLNLKHWAEQRGFYVAHIYAEKQSGRTANRIQLKEMLNDPAGHCCRTSEKKNRAS